MNSPARQELKLSDAFLMLALGISLVLNVYQYRQGSSVNSTAPAGAVTPKLGLQLDKLHLKSADGMIETLSLKGEQAPTVVYVMSPECKWCKANLDKVNALASNLSGRYRIVGVSSHLNPSDGSMGYKFPLFYADNAFPEPRIPLSITPQTLLFSKDGELIKKWDGAYSSEMEKDIKSYFQLPSRASF